MNACAYHFHTVIIGSGLISLAHNINLVVSMSECLLTTPNTHTPHHKWCMKLQNINLVVKDRHNPFHSHLIPKLRFCWLDVVGTGNPEIVMNIAHIYCHCS